jgi:hypothetical protein
MSDSVLLAERIRALERRLAALEAQDPVDQTQFLLASGARAGAAGQAQTFGNVLYAPNYLPTFSTDPDSQQFNAGSGGIPTGWTQVDAAAGTSITAYPGFWSLTGSSADTAWQFKKQMSALNGSSAWNSFTFGPILYHDPRLVADTVYRFGLYADNSGSPNQNVFLRVVLVWDSAAGFWKVRAERKDGTTQTDGTYFNLYQIPIVQPLYLRVLVRTSATNVLRAYIGNNQATWMSLMNVNATYTWNTPWAQLDLASRQAGGVGDFILVGGLNRTADT